jgi:hypothetical protein
MRAQLFEGTMDCGQQVVSFLHLQARALVAAGPCQALERFSCYSKRVLR